MRNLEKHRRAGVLAAAVAAGVLCAASPAAADVTVSPPSAPQGSGTDVTFTVTNTAQTAITKVKLVLPPELPVAEAYPLSTDNWAPQITHKKLPAPMDGIHGEAIGEAASDITWIAMPGRALGPGKSAELTVAMGPMPSSAAQMSFAVEPTYADPAKGTPMPPAVLTLTPAVPGQEAATHGGHSGTTGSDTSTADAATFQALIDAQDSGPGFWTIAGWIVAALAAAAGVIAVLRARRRPETAPEEQDEEKELVSAAPKASNWRYQE